MPDIEEVIWAAGFFDGEGCTSVRRRPDGRIDLRIDVGQKDRRPLERFSNALGGRVVGPYHHGMHRVLYNGDSAFGMLLLLWPYLCDPKKEQARAALLLVNESLATRRRPRGFRSSYIVHDPTLLEKRVRRHQKEPA